MHLRKRRFSSTSRDHTESVACPFVQLERREGEAALQIPESELFDKVNVGSSLHKYFDCRSPAIESCAFMRELSHKINQSLL